jgi:ferredoxin-nitrate reductase
VPDRISDPWGSRAPYGAGQPWPVRVDQHLAEGVDEADVEHWAESASVLHSNGDGIDIAVKQGRIVGVRGVFNTQTDYTETYGHDLATGAAFSEQEHRARGADGRAFPHAAPYEPAPEQPDEEFPLLLTTGRTIYHFHTRTKTGRAPELDAAAPEVWVELSSADARRLGVAEGDRIRVRSRRGVVEAPARIGGARPGVVFIPFHYGYWDGGEARAANELTLTSWDPVSKQPVFKVAAVRVEG